MLKMENITSLEINKIFSYETEEEALLRTIRSIDEPNCMEEYHNYLKAIAVKDSLEEKLIKMLNDKHRNFIIMAMHHMYNEEYRDHCPTDKLNIVMEMYEDESKSSKDIALKIYECIPGGYFARYLREHLESCLDSIVTPDSSMDEQPKLFKKIGLGKGKRCKF